MTLDVLMAAYNAEEFISIAIQSILNQSHKDFNFIIIDDGSNDRTQEIINLFKDKRIEFYRKDHSGLSDTLNYGISKCTNDLIALMDADDISHPNRLLTQIKFLSENPDHDIVGTNITLIDKSNKPICDIIYPQKHEEIIEAMLINSVVPSAAALFKRKVFETVGLYDKLLDNAMDYDLWLRCIGKFKFYNIQELLYFYRRNIKSITGSVNKFIENRKNTYEIMNKYIGDSSFKLNFSDNVFNKNRAKFLIRYSPKFEFHKIWNNDYLNFIQKILYVLTSFIPYRLRSLYFYFNLKLRSKFLIDKYLFNKKNVVPIFEDENKITTN